MEDKKLIKELHRMCNSQDSCVMCPIDDAGLDCDAFFRGLELVIGHVNEWSKENPAETRQSKFLKQYPNTRIKEDVLAICPQVIDTTIVCHADKDCENCRKRYWSEEIE